MLRFPDRLTSLIERLERGQPLTPADVNRTAALQALDIARIGEDFVRDAVAREAAHTEAMRQSLEAKCPPK